MDGRDSAALRVFLPGYLPPPHFGPSTVYMTLLEHLDPRRVEVQFFNMSAVTDVAELGRPSAGKLLLLLRLLAETIRARVKGCTHMVYPFAFGKLPIVKDAAVCLLFRVLGGRVVLFAHGFGVQSLLAAPPGRLWRWLFTCTLRSADGAVVLGEALRSEFSGIFKPSAITVVHLGLDVPAGPPKKRRSRSGGPLRVLFLSNLIEDKGVFEALRSVAALAVDGVPVSAVFAGAFQSQATREKFHSFVNERELSGVVTLVEGVSGAAKWKVLSDADVLVFPTYYVRETFGLVILEAMAYGLPVIATPRGAIPELVRDGVDGFIVPERDVDAIRQKLVLLSQDAALLESLGDAAAARYRRLFTGSCFAERFERAVLSYAQE